MSLADFYFQPELLSFVDAHDAASFRRLEDRLLDAEWVNAWCDFLRRLHSRKLAPEVIARLPAPLTAPLTAPAAPLAESALYETPHRMVYLIEQIAKAPEGLAKFIDDGQLSRGALRELLLHPAGVADLHLALGASDSLYWITRVEEAIRLNREKRRGAARPPRDKNSDAF